MWVYRDPVSTRFMEQRLGELRRHNPGAALKHHWVGYENIAVHLKRAIIAAEDAKFVDHEGFDWAGIQRAMEENRRKGKLVAGGSTITQQLAKNLFLSSPTSTVGAAVFWNIKYLRSQVATTFRVFEVDAGALAA